MDSKRTYIPCSKCNKGFIYNEDSMSTKKCKCFLDFQRETKLRIMLEKANIPIQLSSDKSAVDLLGYSISKDYVGSDENGNLPKIKKFIKHFDEKYSSLNMYFYGAQGVQKSTLTRVIGREVLKQGKTVYFTLADTLIKMLIDSERDEELKAECNRILNVDLLIIDELDESKITKYRSGYQVPFLVTFLKRRIEALRKSTIFCSNREIDNMGDFFGESLQDLIKREILDKSMIFSDNYESQSKAFKVESLWD